jgi:hypothetical protein
MPIILNSSIWWRDVLGPGWGNFEGWFKSNVRCRVGNDNNVEFWNFKWFGNQPFCALFPKLYAKESLKMQGFRENGEHFLLTRTANN